MDDKTALLIFAVALGLWLALVVGRFVVGWLRLLRMRFGPGDVVPSERGTMPMDMAAILDQAGASLKDLGFEYEETLLFQPLLRGGAGEPAWSDTYFHPGTGSWASVQIADVPEPGLATAVSFTTYYADRVVGTENRRLHLLFPPLPSCDIQDAESASLEEHWACHRRRIEAVSGPVLADRDEVRRRHRSLRASLFDFWVETGFMRPAGQDWRLTPKGAWHYLRRSMAGNRRLASLPPFAKQEELDVRVLADLHAWRANERVLAHSAMSRRGKVLWFVASAIAGAAAFGYITSWDTVPILFGILLIHEFGHALVMRAVGYQGLSVLVLPFLGAVAIGRKDDAGPWQKLAVLLAGPLPGLILGVISLRLGMDHPEQHDLLTTMGAMAVVINLFNLLPFTPLDGGQVVDTFLFARRPRLHLSFFAGSAAALAAIGIALETPALSGAGLLLAAGVPAAWRRMRLLTQLNPDPDEDPVTALFKGLHRTPGRCPSFAQRMQSVRVLLPRLRGRAPTLSESLGGLSAYVAAIVLPIALLWDTGVPQQAFAQLTRPSAVAQRTSETPDWQAQLAQAATPEERWKVLWEAGQWFEEADDFEQAGQRYREALAEAANLPADASSELHRLDTRIALARVSGPDVSRSAYIELIPKLRDLPGSERQRLADVLEALDWVDPGAGVKERTARLKEAIAVREALDSGDPYNLLDDRVRLARHLDSNGDSVGAEALLRKNLDVLASPRGVSVAWQLEAIAWFYIAHGRADEAEKLLLAFPSAAQYNGRIVRQALAWTYLAQGKAAAAREKLAAELGQTQKHKLPDWQLLPVMLDLVHASDGLPEEDARWLQKAMAVKAAMGKDSFRAFRAYTRSVAETEDWEQARGKARLAVLKRLAGDDDQDESSAKTCR